MNTNVAQVVVDGRMDISALPHDAEHSFVLTTDRWTMDTLSSLMHDLHHTHDALGRGPALDRGTGSQGHHAHADPAVLHGQQLAT